MQFERKKNLLGLSVLVAGVALAGCGGSSGGGDNIPSNGVIAVDGNLGLGTSTVLSVDQAGSNVSLTDGNGGSGNGRTAFRPAGTSGISAGSAVGTVEGFGNVLPGLRSSRADEPILISSGGGVPDVNTGLYLQTNGNITVGAVGSSGSTRADSPLIALGAGSYRVRINGPLFVQNGGNRLTINNYFQFEFTVTAAGQVGLPNRVFGTIPANGSPGVITDSFGNRTSLTLTTSEFPTAGGTTSLSLRGTNANRDQDRTVSTVNGNNGATFSFSGTSDFVVPGGGLNAVVYRADKGFGGNQD